jgi:hypothetical protein
MPNNSILWSPEPVLTGISQETKQNNFVEEQYFTEDFLFGLKSSRWFRSFSTK